MTNKSLHLFLFCVGLLFPVTLLSSSLQKNRVASERTVGSKVKRPFSPNLNAEKVERLLKINAERPFPKRLERISRAFRNTPYSFSPLGEGLGHSSDQDPRIRFDRFDCTTYVETMLALTYSQSIDDTQGILDRLRYLQGQVSFATRKHFPTAQWIPDNIAAGFFVDITKQIAGSKTQLVSKNLTAKDWARRKPEILPELGVEQIPLGEYNLPIVPFADIPFLLDKIPNAVVVNFVRADFHNIPVRVSHQGFLFRRHGRLILRHAIAKSAMRVVDEDFSAYIERAKRYKSWPVSGINLLKPQKQYSEKNIKFN